MVFYPLKFRFYFLSKKMRNIETNLLRYDKVCHKVAYYNKHRFRLEQQPGMREYENELLLKKEFLFKKFINKKTIFHIYNKNTAIPVFLLFRRLHIYNGSRFFFFRFVKQIVLNTKIGKYVRTKRLGCLIHKNNKIYKKMKKKMKQLLAKALQRKVKRSKKSKAKSVKKKKK